MDTRAMRAAAPISPEASHTTRRMTGEWKPGQHVNEQVNFQGKFRERSVNIQSALSQHSVNILVTFS
jgi:hypothetical protein